MLKLSALALAFFAAAVTATPAGAQCPDGSPPPCRSQTVASAASRRVNPPLDDRTWIVVPFDNLARSADVDWMRSAAVNLLYLDMSRWRDIRVIDDERVADLLRETQANEAQAMSLNTGLSVARRAGAGRLVMGDLLKVGNRTRITAKVFDVRGGQRLRSVSEETSVADSVMPLFGKLAQRILNVAPPQGANVGALGTTSVGAYQEYLAGIEALNGFELREARRRLEKALELDSTFALAHYKLALTLGWLSPGVRAQRTHAESAARLMIGLPARERSLITGQLYQTTGNWTDACQTYAQMLRTDSLDVEAIYGLGECLYHDPTIGPDPRDSTRLRFRANWQQSIRAFTRVLELDPQYHLAYQHIIDALTAERHTGQMCTETSTGRQCRQFAGYLLRTRDSVHTTPADVRVDTATLRAQAEQYVQSQSRRRNLAAALEVAERWVRAAPDEPRAHAALANVLVLQGQIARAAEVMPRAVDDVWVIEDLRRSFQRMEIAVKLGRARDAIRIYDSLRTVAENLPNSAVRIGNVLSGYGPVFGRLVEFDSLVTSGMTQGGAPADVIAYQLRSIRAALGAPIHDSLSANERALFARHATARGPAAAAANVQATLLFSLRMPRTSWPPLDTASRDPKLRPAIALSRGDTAALRRAADTLTSLLRGIVASASSDTAYAIIATDAYLALGDTTAALRVVRYATDTVAMIATYFPLSSQGFTPAAFAPRLMLLRADLAAARGHRDEARVWYDRFIDIWSTAVTELQPVVERARRARASLGAP
jgi:tetratricopeptide (TPR) repeat protein/TolB-like protein